MLDRFYLPKNRVYGKIIFMSILEIKNLSHKYDEKILFNNASLSIASGEHVGIVGLNGAGKSTFVNILNGTVIQDEGEVKWLAGTKISYLDQHADIDRTLTVIEYLQQSYASLYADNEKMEKLYSSVAEITNENEMERVLNKANAIMERLTDSGFFEIDAHIKKIGNGLGLSNIGYDTLISALSGGQRAKIMLAKLILEEPDCMILDEPTNFLDIEHVASLITFLNNIKKTVIVISHDTDFLDKVCTSIVNIENGNVKKYNGNYTQFSAMREMNAKQYEEDYLRQQREIKKLEDYIAKNSARASTAGMANARKKQLDKIEVIAKPRVIYDAVFNFPYSEVLTKTFLEVKNLSIGYNGKAILPPINFTLNSTDKIWIRGTNGIGKTTLLKTLMRKIPAISGTFDFHISAKKAYLEQDLDFYNPDDNAMGYYNRVYPQLDYKEVRSDLAKVGIKGDLATNPVSTLSGGEQVRIKLAVLCNTSSNILILDEPTNHLDVRAKESLKKAINAYPGAVILVSHERQFAEPLCNKILDVK